MSRPMPQSSLVAFQVTNNNSQPQIVLLQQTPAYSNSQVAMVVNNSLNSHSQVANVVQPSQITTVEIPNLYGTLQTIPVQNNIRVIRQIGGEHTLANRQKLTLNRLCHPAPLQPVLSTLNGLNCRNGNQIVAQKIVPIETAANNIVTRVPLLHSTRLNDSTNNIHIGGNQIISIANNSINNINNSNNNINNISSNNHNRSHTHTHTHTHQTHNQNQHSMHSMHCNHANVKIRNSNNIGNNPSIPQILTRIPSTISVQRNNNINNVNTSSHESLKRILSDICESELESPRSKRIHIEHKSDSISQPLSADEFERSLKREDHLAEKICESLVNSHIATIESITSLLGPFGRDWNDKLRTMIDKTRKAIENLTANKISSKQMAKIQHIRWKRARLRARAEWAQTLANDTHPNLVDEILNECVFPLVLRSLLRNHLRYLFFRDLNSTHFKVKQSSSKPVLTPAIRQKLLKASFVPFDDHTTLETDLHKIISTQQDEISSCVAQLINKLND